MKAKRIIVGALMSGGVAVAGLGLAAPAQAGPSYWHYCPGHWEYTVPVPPGTDLSVCHWFAVPLSAARRARCTTLSKLIRPKCPRRRPASRGHEKSSRDRAWGLA
jgi:hypothetical protein